MNGPLTVRRVRYWSAKTRQSIYPLDSLLLLPSGEVTASLARRALHLTTQMSFAAAQEELRVQHEVRLTDSTLDLLAQQVGGVAEADRQKVIAELSATPPGVAREDQIGMDEVRSSPEVLYVSTDGVMYPTRYREDDPERPGEKRIVYQEMKAGCIFWQDRHPKWSKRVLAGRDDSQAFGLSVWAMAMRCGLAQSPVTVFISDGGAWCDTVAETYFPEAVRILDFYHLSEYVWNAARGMYADPKAAKAWAEKCLHILKDSSGRCLLTHLERSRAARLPAAMETLAPLDTLMEYLRPRLHMTDYSDYLQAGYCIGSGMMESTCNIWLGID